MEFKSVLGVTRTIRYVLRGRDCKKKLLLHGPPKSAKKIQNILRVQRPIRTYVRGKRSLVDVGPTPGGKV